MENITNKPGIAFKLVEIMKECNHVIKNGTNENHGYTYATCADVLQMVNAALSKYQICSIVTPELIRLDEVTTSKGTPAHLATVKVNITLIDGTTGETLTIAGMGSGQDSNDKAIMKAQTAAIKYAYLLTFAISTEDDPEKEEKIVTHKTASYSGSTRGKADTKAPFSNAGKYYCSDCGAVISEKVESYSRQRFGRPLCLNCQHGQRRQA